MCPVGERHGDQPVVKHLRQDTWLALDADVGEERTEARRGGENLGEWAAAHGREGEARPALQALVPAHDAIFGVELQHTAGQGIQQRLGVGVTQGGRQACQF
jgi:hypothetical protein